MLKKNNKKNCTRKNENPPTRWAEIPQGNVDGEVADLTELQATKVTNYFKPGESETQNTRDKHPGDGTQEKEEEEERLNKHREKLTKKTMSASLICCSP